MSHESIRRAAHAGVRSRTRRSGLTLVELLVASAVLALLAAASAGLVSAVLDSHADGLAQSSLYAEGSQIMDRLTETIRRATFVMVPNGRSRVRNMLVVSGFVNDDNDFYFGDSLFPRIDEDPDEDMDANGVSGVRWVDDDGDGWSDWGSWRDDDEDGQANEDRLDGIDNDGDGSIDEDLKSNTSDGGKPGIRDIDDDGDGTVDEGGDNADDDEDGAVNEDGLNARIFWGVGGDVFRQTDRNPSRQTVLSEEVSSFSATFLGTNLFLIELTLRNSVGQTASFSEKACARNVLENTGKRVK